jgi:flagellar hook assembly protein FlgD
MGTFNSFFELKEAISADKPLGAFHMVFTKKVPKLGCTLFDKDGNVLFSGSISLTSSTGVTTDVEIEGGNGMRPGMFEFLNAYPNPSSGQFSLSYALGSKRDVEVQMIDANGQILYSRIHDSSMPGIHNISMDGTNLPKGNYFVRIISDGKMLSKPVILQ